MMKSAIFLLWILQSVGFASDRKPVSILEGFELHSQQDLKIDTTDKATAIVFMSAVCPCSQSHFSVLSQLAKEFPETLFVGIHSNAREHNPIRENSLALEGPQFSILRDAKSSYAKAFNALKTPHVFLYNRKGELIYEGGIDNSKLASKASEHYLYEALKASKNNRPPEVSSFRTLGCAIERNSEK